MRRLVSAWICTARGVKPASLFHTRPQTTQRAQFGDTQNLIRISRDAQRNQLAGCIKVKACAFKRTQIGKRSSQNESKFLRF